MEHNLTDVQVQEEIATAERKLVEPDGRAARLWERIKVPASLWKQSQYQIGSSFWVIAILGNRCMYFNHVEDGWGWGRYSQWGTIEANHWQQDEIYHVVFQTLFAIDEGGSGQQSPGEVLGATRANRHDRRSAIEMREFTHI